MKTYSNFCQQCNRSTQHDENGCKRCAQVKIAIGNALNRIDFTKDVDVKTLKRFASILKSKSKKVMI